MAITDRAVNALRRLFGVTRDARDSAESPSADALRYTPSSTYAIWGREDIGGMLSVSQNLMDRYADYESMNDYPDIRCFTGEMLVYVVDELGVITPTTVRSIAMDGEGKQLVAYDQTRTRFVYVMAERPRLTGRNAPVVKINFVNGEHLRVTPEHKILTPDGYKDAITLKKDDVVLSCRVRLPAQTKSILTVHLAGTTRLAADPEPDGVDDVFDITTSTHNILVNGIVCHNSAFHFFANDATQPNLDNGRVVWFVSPDQALVDASDALFRRRLRLEDDLFSIAYTLCQYGNDFEELLVTENGVVGINALAVPTVRRIEKLNGSLIGYVQDVTGRFTSNQEELRRMLAGNVTIPRHVAVFEDWQVVHFRLRATNRRSPFGISSAEGARWIWKRLVMLEDATMIYRLTRAPARFAFYVDVTDVPANRVESFLKRAKRDLKKKKMVNPRNNFLDMRYNPLCLSGETKIPQLNGTEKTLVEMVEAHQRGEEQWVYSVDLNDGNKIKPGKVVWAGPTRKNAQLVKITLDNGESIKVTPDHKMIRRSGEKAEAQTLKVGDSLMPFRRHTDQIRANRPAEYEQIYDPATRRFIFTHRLVAEELGIKKNCGSYVIHHKDFDKRNNDPRNLEEMSWSEHNVLHNKLSGRGLIGYNKSPAKRAKTAEDNRKYNKPALMRAAITPEIREKQKQAVREHKKAFWKDSARAEQAATRMHYVYSDEFVAAIRKLVEENPNAGTPTIAKLANEAGLVEILKRDNPNKIGKLKNIHRDMIRWMCHSRGFKNFEEFKSLVPSDNHKVAKIEIVEEREDTYTLTVAEAHTFATSCGIMVCNSGDEDFFIAVREGRPLSRVEVLSGPDYQCLVGSTKIPLLDGSSKTIEEMAKEGGSYWVYSCSELGEVVPGEAHSARISSNSADIWEVGLDNGEIVECTWNHPFLTRDGQWVLARDLKPNDSLMPFCPETARVGELVAVGNHKVAFVRNTGRKAPVYDLTVNGSHCFAVEQGVFVHNSTNDIEYFQRKLHGALMVPRAFMGQDAPLQGRAILCLTGDTKVPLLDGRTKTMKELATEYKPGETFYVYSMDQTGKVSVGQAHSPQITRPNAEVWEVKLDNDRVVRATPDHPFMMRDGSFRRLDELKAGDSLMPLYRRESKNSRDGMDGYDMYLEPSSGKWCFTHRMVADWKWQGQNLKRNGCVIHHEDFNHRNNSPDNLASLLAEDHLQLHRDHADKTIGRPEVRAKAIENSKWWTQSEECADLRRRNLEKARRPGGQQNAWCKSEKHRRLKSEQMRRQWAEGKDSKLRARTDSEEFRRYSSEKMKESIRLGKIKVRGKDNVTYRQDASYDRLVDVATSYRCTSYADLRKWTGYSTSLINRLLKEQGTTFRSFAEEHLVYGYDPGGHKKHNAEKAQQAIAVATGEPGNHKVVSVRKLPEREDCYDFVVENLHNYLLEAEVFTHNSNEDVRAARVTLQIQRELKNGIEQIIRTDFAARGFENPWGLNFEVMMTVPSNIYELAAMEVKNARADFAARIQPHVSSRWVLEHIYKFTDAEIRKIEQERQREADHASKMGMDPLFGPFTGGRPPDRSTMPSNGDIPPEGLPPGMEPKSIALPPPPPQMPPGMQPMAGGAQQPPPGAPMMAWKNYDREQRLEEHRYRESVRNQHQILDALGKLQENDRDFASRLHETQSFMQEFKAAALRNINGNLIAAPSAGPRRFAPDFSGR